MSDGPIRSSAHGGVAFFTICSNNYLPYAKVLLRSVRLHHPDAALFVCLADEPIDWPGLYDGDFTVVSASALGIPDFRSFVFQYDIMELNTAVKPFMFLWLLEARGFDRVVYFDPDILLTAPLSGVLDQLQAGASLVLTPHLHQPAEGDSHPDDRLIMRAGAYNLGFLAVSGGEEASDILHWWARRLRHDCVNQQDDGLFVDQKFMDLVPGFAPAARISHDRALNLAYWNLRGVRLERNDAGWTVDGAPLVFFHFSGFDARTPDILSKHSRHFRRNLPGPLHALLDHYARLLHEQNYGAVPAATYAYGAFSSGTPIPPQVRRMFRTTTPDWPWDPFATYEAHLHEAAPGASRESASLVVTHLLAFLWRDLPSLRHRLDLRQLDHVRALVMWFVGRARLECGFDPRLIAPVARRLGHRRFPDTSAVGQARSVPGRTDVSVVGYLRAASGVGEAGRRMLGALAATGLRVGGMDVSLGVVSDRGETGAEPLLQEHASGALQVFGINADQLPLVLAQAAPALAHPAYRVVMPFWELEIFPHAWLPAFAGVDEVWAPSAWVQAMLAGKIDKPVLHMPLPLTFDPQPPLPRARFGLPADAFLYYFAFDFLSFAGRKNPTGVLEAFRRLRRLAGSRRVGLVLKTINGTRFRALLDEVLADIDGDPDIVLLDETLSRADALGLLGACDAVVSLHRAEGLGLLVADAMALGKPVIATDYAATTELVLPSTGYPVAYRLIPLQPGDYPMAEGQVWADPDLDHAAWSMLQPLQEEGLAADKVKAAAAHLQAHHGPAAVAASLRERLAALTVG